MSKSKNNSVGFAAFIEETKDIEVVNEVAKNLNLSIQDITLGGIREAINTYAHKKSPQYLVVDVSKSDLPSSDLSLLLEVCEPDVNLVAIGVRNDVGLYRDLIKTGAYDYLVTPLFPDILNYALKNMIFGREQKGEHKSKLGKVIAVMGARGGVGSTFIASNIGAIISKEKARRTVALDLDFIFGTLALYLNLNPNYGLIEALSNPKRIDQVLVEGLLTPVNDRFCIVSSDQPIDNQDKLEVQGIETLLDYLMKLFHYIIIDIPHNLDSLSKAILEHSHIILLVTNSSIGGLRDTGRLIRFLGEESTEQRIIPIINKVGESKKNELTIADFEEALKLKIHYTLPYMPALVTEHINQGKTLEGQDNAIARTLREIIEDILGLGMTDKSEQTSRNYFHKIKKLIFPSI